MKNGLLWAPMVGGVLLMGCSTSLPPSASPAVGLQVANPELPPALQLPPPPSSDSPLAQVCRLGTSCMELDPRPFEACLVGTGKRCVDKATEPLLVIDPQSGELPR